MPYVGILLVYISGAGLDIMEVDAAQYASISLEMLKSGEFLQVLDRHEDYLDKPPLLFWLSAISMNLFGVGSWQYKLPSILFSLLGLFSTYKLAARLYDEKVGRYATMILGGSLAMVMINNDIKTDTILVSAIVFSIWMLVSFLQTKKLLYLVGAGIGIAAAMLTKGPIGLMMPLLAIGGHLLLKRNWKALVDLRWLVLLITVSLLLIPMCVGLYQQYGTNGLKFYFWTQSFGRITGENSWQNDTTPLYFGHVFLWSFLPWTLIAIGALVHEFKNFGKNRSRAGTEFYLVSGITLVWIALSMSKFKLPHYIFVVYPLIAILTAKYVCQLTMFSRWAWTQLLVSISAMLSMAALLVYCFPAGGWLVSILLFLAAVGTIVYFFTSYRTGQTLIPTFVASIGIGLALNLHFYPQVLPYQANAFVGKWIVDNEIPEGKFIGFSTGGRALDFYAQRIIPWKKDVRSTIESIAPGTVVYANQERYNELLKHGAVPEREIALQNFEVQNLTVEFLNPETRTEAVSINYLLFY